MRGALVIAAVAALATPVTAQDVGSDDGWDVMVTAASHVAGVQYSSGVSLIFKCEGSSFDAILAGLPDSPSRPYRTLDVTQVGDAWESQAWRVGAEASAAFSNAGARVARRARLGGVVSVRIPATDAQPAQVYRLDMPSNPVGLDAALAACDEPLTDAADAEQPRSTRPDSLIYWRELPRPQFPSRALDRRYTSGRVLISCSVTADGHLRDCSASEEEPADGGFATAALEAARRARLVVPETGAEGRTVTFPMTFRLADDNYIEP